MTTSFWSLKPHLVSKVWGGEKLKILKGIKSLQGPLGETWEISRLLEGSAFIEQAEGSKKLSDLTSEAQLPYLVKFIDTTDNLSIQVHPNNSFAEKYENSKGKTECWLILDSSKGAGIYLGLKPNITNEELRQAINDKKDLSELLNHIPVKKGDFFFVPAGSIHAIGAGVTLVEIQQSSGVTYRVWDWNRLGMNGEERDLHIDKALKVIEFENDKNTSDFFGIRKKLFSESERIELVRHSDFNVDLYNLKNNHEVVISLCQSKRLNSFVNLSEVSISMDDFILNGHCSSIVDPDMKSIDLTCRKFPTKDSECSSFLHIY